MLLRVLSIATRIFIIHNHHQTALVPSHSIYCHCHYHLDITAIVILWMPFYIWINTPSCTPNRHFFIWFWHIAIDFVTLSFVLNRDSHYEQAHIFVTKRTTIWLGSYNRQRAFDFDRVFSTVKIECPLSITWPMSNCGDDVKQVCNCRKRLSRFQTNVRVTNSIEMSRNQMKRCRFSVQNGVNK